MDKVQKIRKEVEKLKFNLIHGACSSQVVMETRCKEEAYNEVLAILDTMQEEPKQCVYSKSNYTKEDRKVLCERCEEDCEYAQKKEPANNDYENALNSVAVNFMEAQGITPNLYAEQIIRAVKHGAKWQKQKDNNNANHALVEQIKTQQMCYEKGIADMKQQMMAKAIDGDITFDYYGDDNKTYGCIAHDSFCLEDFGLKDRDKVKVIVIKED